MLSSRGRSATLKPSIEQIEIGNSIHIHPSPIRKLSTARAPDLVTKEPHAAFLNSIVVRFDNPLPVVITKPNHALVLNGRAEQLIHIRSRGLQGNHHPRLPFSNAPSGSTRAQRRSIGSNSPELFIAVSVTNAISEISAFGVSRQELVIFRWWKVEISIDVAAAKLQVQQTVAMNIGCRLKDTRVHRSPVHRVILETILPSLATQLAGNNILQHLGMVAEVLD
jgi:hypothetical protein